MDRDYIWEGEYGRRSHLIPVDVYKRQANTRPL